MAKKSDSKKKRQAERNAKAQAKGEGKLRKQEKKIAGDEADDESIEEILAKFEAEQTALRAVNVTVSEHPSKRQSATLIANPNSTGRRKELILFGGELTVAETSKFFNDLYTYSPVSDTWRKYTSKTGPLPRSGHSMCGHPSGIAVMFGGEFSSPKQTTFYHYGDTWVLDGDTKEWTKVEAKKSKAGVAAVPGARSGHRMVVWRNYVLLFGGFRDLSSSTSYFDDLWAFDVTSYQWHKVEFPATMLKPDARSGHSLLPSEEGAVLLGGYSKVKEKNARGGGTSIRGKVHTDAWVLKLRPDLSGGRWERRKRALNAPSPRAGCSMVHHRGRGLLFGGVYDTDETEESLDSVFFNTLHAYQIDGNRWFNLTLRSTSHQRTGAVTKSAARKERAAELSEILKNLGVKDTKEPTESLEDSEAEEDDEDEDEEDGPTKAEYPTRKEMPHPRYNPAIAVLGDVLYIFNGTWEKGERDYTLDSFYSIDLSKLDKVTVYWEDLAEIERAIAEDAVEDDDDDDDEADEDDEDGDEEVEDQNEEAWVEEECMDEDSAEEDAEEAATVGPVDLRPWLPHPKPFESLRVFYAQHMAEFIKWTLTGNAEARGKDLRKSAFNMAQDRWWERREAVQVAEDDLEELGGVASVVQGREVKSKRR